MNEKFKKMDLKELNFPETIFSRDIDSKVFQGMIAYTLSKIEGVQLISKGLIDSLLGRDSLENFSAIFVEQNEDEHSISIKVEVDIKFGICIPEKADEIQSKIIKTISQYSGLHVSSVHVVFKNLMIESKDKENKTNDPIKLSNSLHQYEGF